MQDFSPLECRARTSLADMERGICHGKCQNCEQRFSHATEKGRRQCDIIGEMLARNDTEELYQCRRSTCRMWDILYRIERSLCHGPCNRCRSYDYTFKKEHAKYCYAPVTGRNNQVFSSSEAMAMDAHVRITLEQRVQETTITDSNEDDILASQCDNF